MPRTQRNETFSGARKGFTLIELLIVVAIIAILAAIAVPNFLEAQTRSKVSRTLTDMRTMRTALESYRIDNNNYPEKDRTINDVAAAAAPLGPLRLTTPISYITSLPRSPFNELFGGGSTANPRVTTYLKSYLYTRRQALGQGQEISDTDYLNDRRVYVHDGALIPAGALAVGEYNMKSVGPNNSDDFFTYSFGARVYDPTNGTVSDGDIVTFSDKSNDGKNH